MKYTSVFQGWLGETAHTCTYEQIFPIARQWASFFKERSSSGQKLIIGYDPRFMARRLAEYVSIIMAEHGIKVFLANKPSPSGVLVTNGIRKKSMGTIVFTGDSFSAYMLGVRVYDENGYILSPEDLPQEKAEQHFPYQKEKFHKWIEKGFVEPFDPSFLYKTMLEESVDFSTFMPFFNRVLFDPLHGSGVYYFDRFLLEKAGPGQGYTKNAQALADLGGLEPSPYHHRSSLQKDMAYNGTEIGFCVSPDCTNFEFSINGQSLQTKEIVILLAEHLAKEKEQLTIVLPKSFSFDPSFVPLQSVTFQFVEAEQFYTYLSTHPYAFAVDPFDRFYFGDHGASDALLCGLHLISIFNHHDMSHAKIEQKLINLREMKL